MADRIVIDDSPRVYILGDGTIPDIVTRGGPGSREHFEFIVLGPEGIRGWLTRVERKGTPEPPREAKP